jgi:hypothetical protein
MKAQRHDRYTWTPPADAHCLPGFSEPSRASRCDVTYESHTFWVVWEWRQPSLWNDVPQWETPDAAKLFVRHGGGVEEIRLRDMLAQPLYLLIKGGQERAAFKMAWGLFELVRNSYALGAKDKKHAIELAFVEGRLKKRKNRGEASYKVWIEPEQKTAIKSA